MFRTNGQKTFTLPVCATDAQYADFHDILKHFIDKRIMNCLLPNNHKRSFCRKKLIVVPVENLILLCYKIRILFCSLPFYYYMLYGTGGMLQSNEWCLAFMFLHYVYARFYIVSPCRILNSTNVESGMLMGFFRFISMTYFNKKNN